MTYQKLELLKRKQQLEKIIKTLDHALHLIDNNLQIDPTIFMSLITNMQFEDEQKEWLKTILNEEKVTQLYEISNDKQKELERKFYQITERLKKLYGTDPQDMNVQEIIKDYIQLAEETAMTPIQSLLEDLPEEIED
ncbi:hypothetical protein [Metabacillus malikii]|uniref:Transcriptional regulator n=1 Tax=Metabacillus malikii TaxID=1504265 RepID=A0ABT9ZDW9_9BACI|nr:hypothetical protein [Metabacillus malikii]MDQ0230429.1 putative transcriptional regulator [Metabacillus malikii]